jgi:AcrR family transcriptional regulator
MPRIKSEKLASHRDWRRSQLIEAAAAIALESGGEAITVASVATRAGLSRTSVYEYFASSADLVADLVIDELESFTEILQEAISDNDEPIDAIDKWIESSLMYIADGRHLLAKALNATVLPRERSAAIGAAHRKLLAPLHSNLEALGITDVGQCLTFIQSLTDAASKRIEAGFDAKAEIEKTTAFVIAGIRSLT